MPSKPITILFVNNQCILFFKSHLKISVSETSGLPGEPYPTILTILNAHWSVLLQINLRPLILNCFSLHIFFEIFSNFFEIQFPSLNWWIKIKSRFFTWQAKFIFAYWTTRSKLVGCTLRCYITQNIKFIKSNIYRGPRIRIMSHQTSGFTGQFIGRSISCSTIDWKHSKWPFFVFLRKQFECAYQWCWGKWVILMTSS